MPRAVIFAQKHTGVKELDEEGTIAQAQPTAAVVGGGVVGLAAARALERVGMRVVRVAREPARRAEGDALDSRIYALSPGNVAFLEAIGAWPRVRAARLSPVHTMRVYGDDGRSHLVFDAWEAGVEALAWIAEEGELLAALGELVEPPVAAACSGLEIGSARARLLLDSGAELEAELVVGADGARSLVRAAAGIAVREQSYGQSAVVANFACERPHRNVAFQWFQGAGVLALLPLPAERVSMVWSLPDAEAERLAALEAAALCAEVVRACGAALGGLALIGPARCFPLRRAHAARLVAPRLALAGDAAHVIHPLAGQGANLGLQDARVLAEVIAAREPFRDPGDMRLLRRYERARAGEVLAMDAVVHGLQRLFGAHGALLAAVRNAGLNLTDRLPVVKNALARRAMA